MCVDVMQHERRCHEKHRGRRHEQVIGAKLDRSVSVRELGRPCGEATERAEDAERIDRGGRRGTQKSAGSQSSALLCVLLRSDTTPEWNGTDAAWACLHPRKNGWKWPTSPIWHLAPISRSLRQTVCSPWGGSTGTTPTSEGRSTNRWSPVCVSCCTIPGSRSLRRGCMAAIVR